jgi:hypothetical protein
VVKIAATVVYNNNLHAAQSRGRPTAGRAGKHTRAAAVVKVLFHLRLKQEEGFNAERAIEVNCHRVLSAVGHVRFKGDRKLNVTHPGWQLLLHYKRQLPSALFFQHQNICAGALCGGRRGRCC